jgi:hypothetical protein
LQKITNFDIELYRVSGKTFNKIKAKTVEKLGMMYVIAALDQRCKYIRCNFYSF